MTWLLILTFTMHGQSRDVPVGMLFDQNTCIVAAQGMEVVLEAANPDLDVSWTCVAPAGEAQS